MGYLDAKRKYQEEPQKDDEMQRLMCSVSGCQNRWTVKIDKPMCSFHQWGPKKDKPVEFKHPPIKPFTEIDEDF